MNTCHQPSIAFHTMDFNALGSVLKFGTHPPDHAKKVETRRLQLRQEDLFVHMPVDPVPGQPGISRANREDAS